MNWVIHIWHAQIHRNFCQWVQARQPENSSDNDFVNVVVLTLFNSFTEGSKKTVFFPGLRGGPTFSRGSTFPEGSKY